MRKQYLMAPGPSQVPPEALLQMAQPMYHHRTPRYKALHAEVVSRLQKVFKTSGPVAIMAGSGTSAMEAAVVNSVAPGKKAVVVRGGKFGERWGEICEAFGRETVPLDVEWGTPASPDAVAQALKDNADVAAVCVTLCETSTATTADIEAIGKVVSGTDALLIVDGVSGVGAMDMRFDEWKVDLLCVGSQKALMMPPGLGFVAASAKALEVIGSFKAPAYYLDLKKAFKKAADNDTPYTPAVSLMEGLNQSLKLVEEEGIDNVLARHAMLADAMRAGVQALGLKLVSASPANAVTGVYTPDGVDGGKVPSLMRDKYGVTIAGGQEQFKGKIIRIATMGYMGPFDVLTALGALELALTELGATVELGASLAAAQKVFAANWR